MALNLYLLGVGIRQARESAECRGGGRAELGAGGSKQLKIPPGGGGLGGV